MTLHYRHRSRHASRVNAYEIILPWFVDWPPRWRWRLEDASVLLLAADVVARANDDDTLLSTRIREKTRGILCHLAAKLTWGAR